MTRDEMKIKAEELGLEYKKNISNDGLLELIQNHVDSVSTIKPEDKVEPVKEKPVVAKTQGQINAEERRKQELLKRVIITPVDPNKRELQGEIISCGNKRTKMIKKFVPFNTEWHVPLFIYQVLKDKTFRITKEYKTANGMKYKRDEEIPAYNINELPPLTSEERSRIIKENKE